MAHTYTITSANVVNDLCTVTGTVDGVQVTITMWFSHLSKLPTALALEAYLAPLMLQAAVAVGLVIPKTDVSQISTLGTWVL